jgi:hypothetical protein
MDEDLRRMILEGKEFNIFNINIEALERMDSVISKKLIAE